MSSETWKEIQQTRSHTLSLRERREKRRQESRSIIAQALASKVPRVEPNGAAGPQLSEPSDAASEDGAVAVVKDQDEEAPASQGEEIKEVKEEKEEAESCDDNGEESARIEEATSANAEEERRQEKEKEERQQLEKCVLEVLESVGVTVDLPVTFATMMELVSARFPDLRPAPAALIDELEKLAAQGIIAAEAEAGRREQLDAWRITSCVHSRLSAFLAAAKSDAECFELDDNLESLLSLQTLQERRATRANAEIAELLHRRTFLEQQKIEKFKSRNGALVRKFCEYETRDLCESHRRRGQPRCPDLHFRKIIQSHTDTSLGDCSFLNTCFHIETCKYIHYEIDAADMPPEASADADRRRRRREGRDGQPTHFAASCDSSGAGGGKPHYQDEITLYPPQWIQCDIRHLDMTVLGKFAVIMGDPPWDIHMELPYGTMSDVEMKSLDIPCLQDSGYMFLWVTGRAMETGRDCLRLWGYRIAGELLWVKTNQLQRIIRTGRTGHWLNHGKEHCLIGVKGQLRSVNRGLDCDVIVSEVRATSHKPDEIYGIIERLSPGTRKLELFGRPHNVQPNWITLGNQLDGVRLIDPDVVAKFKAKYPSGVVTKPHS